MSRSSLLPVLLVDVEDVETEAGRRDLEESTLCVEP